MMHQKQTRAITTAIAIGLIMMPALARGTEQYAASGRIVVAQSSGDRCRGNQCGAHKRHDEKRYDHDHKGDKRKDDKLKDDIALGLFGLAVGAIVAGAVADKEVPAEVVARERWLDRCAARHRFFDRSTGTFIGR